MPHYKNQDSSVLYWLDEGDDPSQWLPEGAEEVTEEEAEVIRSAILKAVEAPALAVTQVTMRQARLALLQAGLLGSIQAALQAIPDEMQRQAALIEWEFAATVDRDSPWVVNLAASLGLTEEMLDGLFLAASQL